VQKSSVGGANPSLALEIGLIPLCLQLDSYAQTMLLQIQSVYCRTISAQVFVERLLFAE
jgi:hypothetical protein